MYVNGIVENINCTVRMFADDCVLYRVINNLNDCTILQGDIDRIKRWCSTWHMNLNVKKKKKKTVHMCFPKKKKKKTISV